MSGGRDSQSDLLRKYETMLGRKLRDLFGRDMLSDLDRRRLMEMVKEMPEEEDCDRKKVGAKRGCGEKETFWGFDFFFFGKKERKKEKEKRI